MLVVYTILVEDNAGQFLSNAVRHCTHQWRVRALATTLEASRPRISRCLPCTPRITGGRRRKCRYCAKCPKRKSTLIAQIPTLHRVLSSGWTGWLLVSLLAGVHVTAASQGATDLVIVEAANGIVKVVTPTAEVSVSLTVVNTSSKTITGIVAQVAPFSDAAGARTPVSLGPASFALEAFASQTLKLRGSLQQPGVHVTKLWLGAGSTAQVTTIEITHPERPAVVTISALQPFEVVASWWGPITSPEQRLKARLTGGSAAFTLPAPELQVLYKPDDKVTLSAPGVRLHPATAAQRSFSLQANGSVEVPVAFTGFPSAGRYEATLKFAQPASAPEIRTVTIYVREHWLVAALWITLGVLVAFVLRAYGAVLAPRLAQETRVAAVFEQFAAARSAAQRNDDKTGASVVAQIHEALVARWNTMASNGRLVGSTDLDLYEAKIPLLTNWLQLRGWLRMELPPVTHALAREALAAVQAVLVNPAAAGTDVSAQSTALAGLPFLLEQSALKELADTVQSLDAALAGRKDPRLDTLRKKLKALASSMPTDATSIVTFAEALNRLDMDRIAILIGDLEGLLRRPTPRQIEPDEWQGLTTSISQTLRDAGPTAESRIAAYTNAFAMIASPIARAVESEAQRAVDAGGVHLAQWQSVLGNARTVLAGIATQPHTGEPADLEVLIDDSDKVHRAAVAEAAPLPRNGPNARTQTILDIKTLILAPSAPVGAGWLNFLGYGPRAASLQEPNALANARRRERSLSLLALAAVLCITVLAGMQALWSNNWTWGGVTSYLFALLWGAGLSGFTFDGVKNLIGKWT